MLVAAASCATPPEAAPSSDAHSVAIEALSRGSGVPAATRAAYERARGLLEEGQRTGTVVSVAEARIGLEGERRLCARFRDAASAEAALVRLRALSDGVELLDVRAGPCPR